MLAGLYFYTMIKQEMVKVEIDQVFVQQESRALQIDSFINARVAEVTIMSKADSMRTGDVIEMIKYLASERYSNQFTYDEIGFFDLSGRVTRLSGETVTLHDTSIFHTVVHGNTYVSNPLTPLCCEYSVGYIAVPIYDANDQIMGALYASYKFPPNLYEDTLKIELGDFYVYGQNGDQLYAKETSTLNELEKMQINEHLKSIAIQPYITTPGKMHFKVDLSEYIVFYQHVTAADWIIFELKDKGELEKLAAPMLWKIIITICLVVLFIAIIFYVYFDSIISRLKDILRVTSLASQGTFDSEHLDAYSGDEIGNLANSINGMMGRIQIMFDRLDAAINQNTSPVFIMDERYVITYCNKAAEELVGYTSEELIGKATPLLFMDMNDVRERAEKLSNQLGRPIQPGVELFLELRRIYNTYEYELPLFHREGKRIPVYNRSSSLRDRNGKFTGIIAILTDLSEQRELEKVRNRLQTIVESAMDLIASADHHARMIYINEAGKKILGIEHEQWEMQSLASFIPRHLYFLLLRGSIKAKRDGFFETTAQFENRKGKDISVSIVIVAQTDTYTGELLYSCISRDITEQLEVQNQLVQATEAAEEANRAKSNFLALMSHEIRTPLNAIVGLSQLMNKTELDHIQREYVHRIKDSSEILVNVVTDILDFSKLEVKKIEPDYTMFQLHYVMNHLADQLCVFLGSKDELEFKIYISPNVPQSMIGDAMRLEQVLSNLCVNAIKFTTQGIVELMVELVEENSDGYIVQFSVKDTGIGMTELQLKTLFQPFTQADSSTTRKYGGTGLGLVISQSLVGLLGGQLNVESKYGVGSCFRFQLPFKRVANERIYESNSKQQREEHLVWVIENDPAMSEHWNGLLQAQRYSAIHMKSWKQAYYRLLRLGEGAFPSFILMDMEMYDMYGIDTWLEFRKAALARNIPLIVMTTAFGREELLALDVDQQPEKVLTKPITQLRFEEAVRYAVLKEQPVEEQLDDESAASTTEPISKINVLLAEDNKVNQLVAVEMLKHCYCNVTVASNGIEALHCLKKDQFDIIFMDIHMPEMDGVEAVRIIRNELENLTIPIIALTANIMKSDHERYMQTGMNAILTKPITIEQLEDVLSHYVRKREISTHVSQTSYNALAEPSLKAALMELKTVHADEALDRLQGKLNIYVHMLKQYYEDYALAAETLEQHYSNEQYDKAERLLHTLKGASSYLAAHELLELAKQGETLVKTRNTQELKQFYKRLQAEMSKFRTEFEQMLTNINKF